MVVVRFLGIPKYNAAGNGEGEAVLPCRAVIHSLLTNDRAFNFPAIRVEIIATSINYLAERLCLEQDDMLNTFKGILQAKTCHK